VTFRSKGRIYLHKTLKLSACNSNFQIVSPHIFTLSNLTVEDNAPTFYRNITRLLIGIAAKAPWSSRQSLQNTLRNMKDLASLQQRVTLDESSRPGSAPAGQLFVTGFLQRPFRSICSLREFG
jgi:hypothetical protein